MHTYNNTDTIYCDSVASPKPRHWNGTTIINYSEIFETKGITHKEHYWLHI